MILKRYEETNGNGVKELFVVVFDLSLVFLKEKKKIKGSFKIPFSTFSMVINK